MTDDIKKLREIVLGEADLQRRLQEISDQNEFVECVLEVGKKFGLEIESEDVLEEMRERRRVWIERWI